MVTKLICCEICVMGCEKLRFSVMKLASAPSVRPQLPESAMAPPTMLTMTHEMFPRFAFSGMMRFEMRFARLELSRSRPFTARKSALASASWLNTFTTFWPSIISSMKPSTAPRSACCWAK